jgi:hypothetical protein
MGLRYWQALGSSQYLPPLDSSSRGLFRIDSRRTTRYGTIRLFQPIPHHRFWHQQSITAPRVNNRSLVDGVLFSASKNLHVLSFLPWGLARNAKVIHRQIRTEAIKPTQNPAKNASFTVSGISLTIWIGLRQRILQFLQCLLRCGCAR